MKPTLHRVIETICESRDEGPWDKLNEGCIDDLVQEYGEHDLINRLYREIPRTVPFEVVCDLFNLLVWRTNDNGADASRSIEQWLRDGLDTRQLLIALNAGSYPFVDANEMEQVLLKLADRIPFDLRIFNRCKYLIAERSKLRIQ
jgi:hypothetical protein